MPEFAIGDEMIVDVKITDPSGNPVVGMQQNIAVSEKKHPQLPFAATMVFVAAVEFRRYGAYTATALVKHAEKDVRLEAARKLHIDQP